MNPYSRRAETVKADSLLLLKEFQNILESLRGAKILITGSTGMIGSYLGWLLLYLSDKLDLHVFLHGRNTEKLKLYYQDFWESGRCHIVTFDLAQKHPRGVLYDYIIHTASLASNYCFQMYPTKVMEPNILGTWMLLDYCKESGAKLLLCSSSAIYGETERTQSVLSESTYGIVDPLSNRACYAESKRCAEQMCAAFTREYAVKTNIVRISHTYGPTFDIENDGRVLPRSIKKILSSQDIELYDDPDAIVQYTYVGDICSAILDVMVQGVSGEAYNVCGDEMLPLPQIIEYMLDGTPESLSKLVLAPIDDRYAFKKGSGVNIKKLDNGKLKALGWKSLFSGKIGFRRTIQSYI